MDDETRRMNLEQIARIRRALSSVAPAEPGPGIAPRVPIDERTRDVGRRAVTAVRDELHRVRRNADADAPQVSWGDDPAVMAAQMAAAEERDRLMERVRLLTADNERLRVVLREILRRAAEGI